MLSSLLGRPLWRIVLLDVGVLVVLATMTADDGALDLFHIAFLLLVVQAFLVLGWPFWARLALVLAVTEVLIVRAGDAVWQDIAEPMVLAAIATLVFVMHGSRDRVRGELEEQASHDALTGLLNRRALQAHLDTAVTRMHQDAIPFAVIYIDLDDFKAINDTYGHDVGDLVLAVAARRVEASTREGDVVGRIGGDEFGLLLRSATSVDTAADVAQRLIAKLQEPFIAEGVSLRVSASVGIAMAGPARRQTPQSLLVDADKAMYTVKRQNKGAFAFASDASATDA